MSAPDAPAPTAMFPGSADAPTFAEPWQAQAFALTVALHKAGHFTWPEWAAALSAEIAKAGPDDHGGERYFEFWLAALEKLTATKGLAAPAEIDATAEAWREAYLHTPHGQPVELEGEA